MGLSKIIFAQRLKELRIEKDVSLDDVAKEIGISKTTLNKYELQLREPKLSIVKAIADYFQVNLDWLVGFSEERDISVNIVNLTSLYNQLSPAGKEELYKFANYLLFKEQPDITDPADQKKIIG